MKECMVMNDRLNVKLKFGSRKFYSLLATSSVGMVIIFIMLLSDTVIAGNFIGEAGVAAVNLVLPIFSVTAFFSVLVDVGTANHYSLEMGKFNKGRADEFFGQGVILSVAVGILLFVFVVFGENIYFSVINPPADILSMAKSYFRAYPYIVLLYPVSGYLTDMIYADGDELISNISNSVQIIGNIAGSIILCRYFGIAGIGYGTLLSTVLTILITMLHFFRKSNSLHFVWHISLKDILSTSKYGITDGEQYLCNALLVYLLNFFVSKYFGGEFLPVITVIVNIIELSLVFDGIGQAFTPIVNVYLGENNNEGVKDVMKSAQKSAVIEGVVFSAILMVVAPIVPRLYGILAGDMLPYYTSAVRIVAVTFIFSALKYVYSSYYLVKQKLVVSVVMTLICDLVIPPAVGIPLSRLIGIDGLWIGFSVAPVAALLVAGIMVLIRYGKEHFPLLLETEFDENMASYDIVLADEAIVELRNMVEEYLNSHQIEQKVILKVMLMIEECCVLIKERNKDKKVYLQCSVFAGEQNRIILSDTGEVFDLTNEDLDLVSTNAFMVGILMWKHRQKQNLTTTGYNRNEFIF